MSFALLAGELRKLCAAGVSGTLYATTEDNHSVRIVVDAGDIVSLIVGRLKGTAGIAPLKGAGVSRYRFQQGFVVRDGAAGGVSLHELLEEGESLPQPVLQVSGVGDGVLEMIRLEAVECIGPVAHMICADHLRGVETRDGMVAALAAIGADMGDPALAREFRTRVQSRLRQRQI